jgi:hypothetical protein
MKYNILLLFNLIVCVSDAQINVVSDDSIPHQADSSTVKNKILNHAFKLELTAPVFNFCVIGAEYRILDRITLEHWIGFRYDFTDKEIKKSGFVLRTGIKLYLRNKQDVLKQLEGVYLKGELGYLKTSFRQFMGYDYSNWISSAPIYSGAYRTGNTLFHLGGGYQYFPGKNIAIDFSAGIGTTLQSPADDTIFSREDKAPGVFFLTKSSPLTATFTLSLCRVF